MDDRPYEYCAECGTPLGHTHNCKAGHDEYRQELGYHPIPPGFFDEEPSPAGMTGWTCPRCARGNSPYTSTCPCIPLPGPVIT